MTHQSIEGTAYFCGDFVDTDVMSPGRFEPFGGDTDLARIALIDYESPVPFVSPETGRSEYTVIFAGREFGCGSSRETAPQALHYAGAKVVIAKSFGRIFFRNCVNMGLLLPIVCEHPFDETVIGERVIVNPEAGFFECLGRRFRIPDLGPVGRIVEAGGLLPYTSARIAEARAS